jgi:hypothetical protein
MAELLSLLCLVALSYSHHSRLRASVSLVHLLPLLLRKRLDRLELFLLQPGIDCR